MKRVTHHLRNRRRFAALSRALPIAVRAGNALTAPNGQPVYLDPNGRFVPGAPTFSNPFTGFILPGAGASGINIIDNSMQNPMVQQSNLGVQWEFARNYVLRADYLHNFGTHFIIGRIFIKEQNIKINIAV